MSQEQNILNYLQKHPKFLAKHADTLGIRLKESKIYAFSKGKLTDYEHGMQNMASNMSAMLENAQANHQTIIRLMQLNTALMACNTLKQVSDTISGSLKNEFNLPLSAFRLISQPKKKIHLPPKLWLPEKDPARTTIKSLKNIQCGNFCLHKTMYSWLPENAEAESFLHMPLRLSQRTIGIILIAHPDATYFSADTPTDYMSMTANAVTATLIRIMGLHKS